MARRGLTDFGLAPVDVHVPRDEAAGSVASRNTQYSSETPTQTHRELWGSGKAGLFAPFVLCVQRGEGNARSNESFDKTAEAG